MHIEIILDPPTQELTGRLSDGPFSTGWINGGTLSGSFIKAAQDFIAELGKEFDEMGC